MIENRRNYVPRNRENKKMTFSRFIFYFMEMVFLGVIIYALFFSNFMTVASIEIRGNNYIDEKMILEQVNSKISGKIVGLVEKNNLLLIPSNKIKEDLLSRFKQIRDVEINKDFPHKIEIIIAERIPTISMCSAEKCFLLDENGEAYGADDPLNGNIKQDLIKITDESGKEIKIGDFVLEKEYISDISEIKRKLELETNLEIENDFRTPAVISNYVKVKTKEGWDIYINLSSEKDKIAEILNTVLKNNIDSQKRTDLEYIDLRINNKVYYKFRDGTSSEEERIATEKSLGEEQLPANN